ncbi:hypothetical protein GCM10009655_12740 [Rhodoglobus aureus]|uniref:Uncharacterized protein n=2 Tax=Rhodoglobus aureus TaxID=191497 RepID=A0ABN1VKU3_9MICO
MPQISAMQAEELLRAAGGEPQEPYPGRKNVPWKAIHIACGKEIFPRLSNVRDGRGICRHCAGFARGAERRAGRAVTAIAEMKAAGWEPLADYPGTEVRWLARHTPCGTERKTSLNAVRQAAKRNQYGCETCWRKAEGHRVWTAETANHFMLSVDLTPLEPWPSGSSRPWRARHNPCGREVSPRLGNLAAGQGPCNHCGQQEAHRKMMLDDDAAQAMMVAAGLEPIAPFPGVDHPWLCIHTICGREASPSYTNIKRGQGGCDHCGRRALADRFRMPEEQARNIMRKQGLEPLEPYNNSMTPWLCLHTCGKEVRPLLSNAQKGLGICRYCNSTFDYDGPSIVYLVADHHALKVGITKPGSYRITEHTSRGWRLKFTINVPTGDDAYTLEQNVISWWRNDLDAPAAYTPAQMPQWGSTETVGWESTTALQTLEQLVQEAAAMSLEITVNPTDEIHTRPQRPASTRAVGRTRRARGNSSDVTLF